VVRVGKLIDEPGVHVLYSLPKFSSSDEMAIEQADVIAEPSAVILVAVISDDKVEALSLTWLTVSVDTDISFSFSLFPVGSESKMLPIKYVEDFIS